MEYQLKSNVLFFVSVSFKKKPVHKKIKKITAYNIASLHQFKLENKEGEFMYFHAENIEKVQEVIKQENISAEIVFYISLADIIELLIQLDVALLEIEKKERIIINLAKKRQLLDRLDLYILFNGPLPSPYNGYQIIAAKTSKDVLNFIEEHHDKTKAFISRSDLIQIKNRLVDIAEKRDNGFNDLINYS